MNRRRGLSLLLALAMLLTAMPFVGAAAAQGDVAEATYIRNDTGDAVAAYTKGEDGSSVGEAGTFAAGAVWAYLGEETIAEKDYYKASDGSAEKYVEKVEGIASITHKLEVAGGGSFDQGEAHAVTATVKEGGTDVTADYTVKYKVNENEAAAEPPSLIDAGSYTVVVTAERAGYTTLQSTVTVEIKAPAPSPEPMPAITVTGGGTFPYDGKAHAVTATVENGEGYTVFYSTDEGKNWTTVAPSLTEPGELTIRVKATKSGEPDVLMEGSVTLEVTAKPTLTVEAGPFPYDGKAHAVTAKVENGEGYTIEYSTDGGKSWSATAPSRTAVGKTEVKVRATKSGMETLEKDVTLEVTASASSPKMTVNGGTVKYDGRAYTVAVTFTNAKAEDYKIEYSTDNKTWSEKAPGVSEIGSKVTIYVRATPKSGEGETLTGSGVVEIIANTEVKSIATVVNCKNSVNVRAGAGTNTKKIGTAKKGARFECLGKSADGNWYKIQYNSTTVAYIHKDYISVKDETVELPVEVAVSGKIVTVVNCNTSVNVRSGAGTTNSIIGQGKKNAQFTLLATVKVNGATWYKVQYTSAQVGYIHEDYIKVSDAGSGGGTTTGHIATIVNCNHSVNVRSGAGTNYSKIGTAPKNQQYACLGVSSDGNWYQIQYTATQKGYVHKDYIKLSSGSTTEPSEPTGQTATIVNCNEWVNVRAGAGTNTKKLGTAPKGAKYAYLGTSGNWIKVQYTSSQVGYIYNRYVSVSGTTGGTTGGTAGETAQTGYGYVVNCNTSVNVRSAATSATNNIIGQAKKSYVYQILGKSGNWYKIQYTSSTVGYIHDSYFTKATSDTGVKAKVVNCNEWVNVRSAATTSSALLGRADLGAEYTFLKIMNNYAMVIYNGRVGCIHKNYVQVG